YVNDLISWPLAIELRKAALVDRLRSLRRVIFGVFRKIAVGASVGNLLNDPRPLHLLAVLQLGLQCRVALCRHRNLFHPLQTSSAESKIRSRTEASPGRATWKWLYTCRRCGRSDARSESAPK